jgi:hypothetical protein
MNIALLAAIILAVLQLLDIWSTYLFRSVGVHEANPIFGPTFDKAPLWAAAVAKLALASLLIGCAFYARDAVSRTILAVITGLLDAVYAYIVIGNFAVWRRRKGARR